MGHAEEAHKLHQAITGNDINQLVSVIAAHENETLVEIGNEYTKHYGKTLTEALKDARTLGEGVVLAIDLVIPRASFAARTVNNAIAGAGTNEHTVIDVVVHNSNKQITELKEAYSNLFQRDLASSVQSDLSGNFKKVVHNLLEGHSPDSIGNPAEEAETLYKKGEGKWGTDDDYFVQFFSKHSFENLQAINQAYEAKYKHSLEVAIKKETSGYYQDILVALVVPREVYWAHRIRHAISGLGTDDHLLRRAFTLNSKDQLRRIQAVYESVNKGKTLRSDVADDTSGAYKELFLTIIDNL